MLLLIQKGTFIGSLSFILFWKKMRINAPEYLPYLHSIHKPTSRQDSCCCRRDSEAVNYPVGKVEQRDWLKWTTFSRPRGCLFLNNPRDSTSGCESVAVFHYFFASTDEVDIMALQRYETFGSIVFLTEDKHA